MIDAVDLWEFTLYVSVVSHEMFVVILVARGNDLHISETIF